MSTPIKSINKNLKVNESSERKKEKNEWVIESSRAGRDCCCRDVQHVHVGQECKVSIGGSLTFKRPCYVSLGGHWPRSNPHRADATIRKQAPGRCRVALGWMVAPFTALYHQTCKVRSAIWFVGNIYYYFFLKRFICLETSIIQVTFTILSTSKRIEIHIIEDTIEGKIISLILNLIPLW